MPKRKKAVVLLVCVDRTYMQSRRHCTDPQPLTDLTPLIKQEGNKSRGKATIE